MSGRRIGLLATIGPGILVAATGVGAGDLATASFTGSVLGVSILWAVVLGAFLNFVLNEGLARWQLATGDTLLEGCVERLGRPVQWFFLGYLVVWSFLVGAALMSAVGVTSHAILPILGSARDDKVLYGALHSALAVVMVRLGGFKLFERVMSCCIAVMFVTVLLTAAALKPPLGEVVRGLCFPTIPAAADAVSWTVALMGGVGGTVTVLCYGYWIREAGREGSGALRTCRIDLATGYAMTALFGIAMVVIGSRLGPIPGGGATLVVNIAEKLETTLGSAGTPAKWAFLFGAWGAVFSSLLGVWQSIPYLFADFFFLARRPPGVRQTYQAETTSIAYQASLYGLAILPLIGLAGVDFVTMQKTYAVVGALFIPMLAAALLRLNGRADWVGAEFKNSIATTLVLLGSLVFFLAAGWQEIESRFWP